MARNIFIGLRLDEVQNNFQDYKGRGLCLLPKPKRDKTKNALETLISLPRPYWEKKFYFAYRTTIVKMKGSFAKKQHSDKSRIATSLAIDLNLEFVKNNREMQIEIQK